MGKVKENGSQSENDLQEQIIILQRENAMLRGNLSKANSALREAEQLLGIKERINQLLDILNISNKFDKVFITNVRYEIQYLINGYDPMGLYAKKEKEAADKIAAATDNVKDLCCGSDKDIGCVADPSQSDNK